jgi:hypothetical protein
MRSFEIRVYTDRDGNLRASVVTPSGKVLRSEQALPDAVGEEVMAAVGQVLAFTEGHGCEAALEIIGAGA